MKVVISEREDGDGVLCQSMSIDGKKRVYVGHPEPEDAIIGRDLTSCDEMADLMKEAHAAGVRGEELTVETVKDEE